MLCLPIGFCFNKPNTLPIISIKLYLKWLKSLLINLFIIRIDSRIVNLSLYDIIVTKYVIILRKASIIANSSLNSLILICDIITNIITWIESVHNTKYEIISLYLIACYKYYSIFR